MRKVFAFLAAAVLSASVLAGCGGSAAPATAAAPATTAAAAATTAAPAVPAETAAPETKSEETTAAPETAAETKAEAAAGTVTITDHADRTVTVPTDPKNVVVLDIYPMPSVLTVFLNSADCLKAIAPVSMNAAKNGILSELYPEILNARTDILDGEDVNIEALVAMEPDLVIYTASNKKIQEKLENAGLTAVGMSPTKWNYDAIRTYDEWISLLSQIFPSAKKSEEVSTYSNQVYEMIQEKTKSIPENERKRVLFLFQYSDKAMITSGSSFFGQWWCDAVGAVNVANGVTADNSNAVITMEQVYEWNPDMIVITNFTPTMPEDLYNNAVGSDDWSTVAAVQNHEVYKLPLGTYRTYTPGVDTPLTLEWLAQKAYPELFADINLAEDVRNYYNKLYGITVTDEQIEAMYNPAKEAGFWN
ncbi:MAG: ABC transporter substrate-binding protein [Stomatobaculum sp.]|nr:ABC transporter substrate-binding protein [Stomatobaculum sp.]